MLLREWNEYLVNRHDPRLPTAVYSQRQVNVLVDEMMRKAQREAWDEARRIVARDWYEAEEKTPGSGIHAILGKIDAKIATL